MSLLTWEEIEIAQEEINKKMKEVEKQLIQEDIPKEKFATLTEQLFGIQKIVSEFNEIKDELLKDKI